MAKTGITGKCAAVTFTGLDDAQTFIGRLTGIGEYTETQEAVPDDDICNDVAQWIPGDIVQHSEITLTNVFDTDAALPAKGVKGSVVVSWQPRVAGNTGPTLSGTCFVTADSIGDAASGQRMESSLTFRFNGKNVAEDDDGPVFTPETVAP